MTRAGRKPRPVFRFKTRFKTGLNIREPLMPYGPFDALPASPFARLRALLDDVTPAKPPVSLALGEPQHAPPDFALAPLRAAQDVHRYPPIGGTDEWQAAVRGWLARRFDLSQAVLAAPTQVLPLNGTREGLFLAAQLAPAKPDAPDGGLMAMPNPFYQVYASAALAAGATPLYLDAAAATGFLPDLAALDGDTLRRLRALYLCSPANPQGAIADQAYLRRAYHLAKDHDFLLLVDECYSELYDAPPIAPPPSMLQIIDAANDDDAPVLVFHSLSKRSNLAGLRAGFVAGGKSVMAAYHKLRMVAGPQSPLAAQAAAALAWGDDAHVEENRALYRAKFDMAENILGTDFGFYRPQGGFFLWLNVGNGEKAAQILWREEGLRVLPGAYLTMPNAAGDNIGAPYIRVALVAPLADTQDALTRLRDCLYRHGLNGLG